MLSIKKISDSFSLPTRFAVRSGIYTSIVSFIIIGPLSFYSSLASTDGSFFSVLKEFVFSFTAFHIGSFALWSVSSIFITWLIMKKTNNHKLSRSIYLSNVLLSPIIFAFINISVILLLLFSTVALALLFPKK